MFFIFLFVNMARFRIRPNANESARKGFIEKESARNAAQLLIRKLHSLAQALRLCNIHSKRIEFAETLNNELHKVGSNILGSFQCNWTFRNGEPVSQNMRLKESLGVFAIVKFKRSIYWFNDCTSESLICNHVFE